jgi:hypothetical protein
MAIDISGYSLSDSSGLKFGSSNSKVDGSGRLIVPNQPIMFGSRTNYADQQRIYPWQVNDLAINTNSVYNTSSWFFVAPVAGLYYTAWCGICNGGSSATASATNSGYIGVTKNGTLQHFTHWNTNDVWDTQNLETILYCNVGDTIGWAAHIAPAPDNGSGRGAYGGNHNMATIWFIG